eukprot:36561-Amphidinium_carterae.1
MAKHTSAPSCDLVGVLSIGPSTESQAEVEDQGGASAIGAYGRNHALQWDHENESCNAEGAVPIVRNVSMVCFAVLRQARQSAKSSLPS